MMTRSDIKKLEVQLSEQELQELENYYAFQMLYQQDLGFDTSEIEAEIRAKKFELISQKCDYIIFKCKEVQAERGFNV